MRKSGNLLLSWSREDRIRRKVWRALCRLHRPVRWWCSRHPKSKWRQMADWRLLSDHENRLWRKACLCQPRRPDTSPFPDLLFSLTAFPDAEKGIKNALYNRAVTARTAKHKVCRYRRTRLYARVWTSKNHGWASWSVWFPYRLSIYNKTQNERNTEKK